MAFVSILVRARNDEALIGRTLDGIFAQKPGIEFEVVVCDDGSTDRTREIAARYPVRFFERPHGPYKPGRTLNALVSAANGDIVVFNNSDAVPLDADWLAELVKPLLAEPDRPKFAFVHRHTPSAHPTIPITHASSFILLIFFIFTLSPRVFRFIRIDAFSSSITYRMVKEIKSAASLPS